MIHLNQTVVVEGKYDKIKLQSVLDANIIETGGFQLFQDQEKTALLRRLAQRDGIIVLTDSDVAGFQIRNYIKNIVGDTGTVIHVYIPDIYGKERRKEKPSKEGKLGVEGIPTEVLMEAFEKAGVFSKREKQQANYQNGFLSRWTDRLSGKRGKKTNFKKNLESSRAPFYKCPDWGTQFSHEF